MGAEINLENLQLGSLLMLEVVVALENEFGVSIPDNAPLAKITSSASEIGRFLEKLTRESNATG